MLQGIPMVAAKMLDYISTEPDASNGTPLISNHWRTVGSCTREAERLRASRPAGVAFRSRRDSCSSRSLCQWRCQVQNCGQREVRGGADRTWIRIAVKASLLPASGARLLLLDRIFVPTEIASTLDGGGKTSNVLGGTGEAVCGAPLFGCT